MTVTVNATATATARDATIAGMTTDSHGIDSTGHAAVDADGHQPATAHGGGHAPADHGHGDEALGPIDTAAWLAGALGVLLGLAVTICFVLATQDIQAPSI